MRTRATPALLGALASLALANACVVAPVVQAAGTHELSSRDLPQGSELCELTTADGVTLRGVFVPAGADAPLVVHLLPSRASVTSGVALGGVVAGMRETLLELRERGCASLVVDYRGVGASDGERDPRRLGDDARAMWDEALRRTDADPGRIVLRGASIGSLATAALLDAGASPAAVVLFAPVRAETIAGHAARERKGALLGSFLALFLRRPIDVDLVTTLARTDIDTLVLLPEQDEYLPPDEVAMVEAAVRGGSAGRVVHLEGSHTVAVLRAWGFELDEQHFGGHLSPKLLPAEQELLERVRARARGAEPEG